MSADREKRWKRREQQRWHRDPNALRAKQRRAGAHKDKEDDFMDEDYLQECEWPSVEDVEFDTAKELGEINEEDD